MDHGDLYCRAKYNSLVVKGAKNRARMLFIISGHVMEVLANERRHYICNIFSHWLRLPSRVLKSRKSRNNKTCVQVMTVAMGQTSKEESHGIRRWPLVGSGNRDSSLFLVCLVGYTDTKKQLMFEALNKNDNEIGETWTFLLGFAPKYLLTDHILPWNMCYYYHSCKWCFLSTGPRLQLRCLVLLENLYNVVV